jgi:hypothetical protein
MNCPECHTPYVCPCRACVARQPNKTAWILEVDDFITCPACGLTHSEEWWMDEEYRQIGMRAVSEM